MSEFQAHRIMKSPLICLGGVMSSGALVEEDDQNFRESRSGRSMAKPKETWTGCPKVLSNAVRRNWLRCLALWSKQWRTRLWVRVAALSFQALHRAW
ncbi:unnamed protein product, partial [Mycena citricolor]